MVTWLSVCVPHRGMLTRPKLSEYYVALQAVVPIWVLALYHSFAYAASRFGGSALWQRYGARAHSFLSAAQVMTRPPSRQAPACEQRALAPLL